jgi:CubicO group peptidase (beta-lactamase class C family)
MKPRLAFLPCAIALAAGCTPPSAIVMTAARPPAVNPSRAALIREIEGMTRQTMSWNGIPGLSIALADSHGTFWEAGFGYADDERKISVDVDTMFSIQSMSKTFTGVGVLTAVRDGLLDLDQPISHYIPDFRIRSIFESNPQDHITVRHLLTHTAGFTHEAPAGNNSDPGEPSFDEHVKSISDTWLMFPAGQRFQYSNLGIDLAGAILQKVSRRAFSDCLRERVFEPLDLRRTTADPSAIRVESNRATGHQFGLRNLPIVVPMSAAGGVYSSAHDLGVFVSSMLRRGGGSGSLLPPALFREMETTPMHGGYGLGVSIGRRKGDLYFTHGGGGYGFLTCMAWYPTLDLGIVILTNSANHNSAHVALAGKIVDRLVAAGAFRKAYSLSYLPVCRITLDGSADNSSYFDAHPGKTEWKNGWSWYLGSYRPAVNAPLRWYAKLIISMGIPRHASITVSRQGRGMAVDGVPLLEEEPGLFFSMQGEALDFRSTSPTWKNIRIQRL